MTGVRMLQVMVAVTLFTTTLIMVYNGLIGKNLIVYRVAVLEQGHRYAARFLQKVQAELIGKVNSFADIHNIYNGGVSDSLVTTDEVYHVNIRSNYCDASGDISNPNTNFQKVEVRVFCVSNTFADTIRIGTAVEPISRIFANIY